MVEAEDKETRRLLLSFYSAELNSHARLIIGASALFFTIVTLITEIAKVNSLGIIQMWIGFLSLWFISSILWFSVMRYLTYGSLAHATTVALINIREGKYADIHEAVRERALEDKILVIFPTALFISVHKEKDSPRIRKYGGYLGFLLCIFLGFLTTLALWTFIGINPLTLLEIFAEVY